MNKYERYEVEKQRIARESKSWQEYEKRIKELVKKLKL